MSFFGFKSKNKQPQTGALPSTNRSLTSSDGSNFNQPGSLSSLRDAQNPSRTGAGSAMGNNSNMVARGATPDNIGLQQQQQQVAATPSPSAPYIYDGSFSPSMQQIRNTTTSPPQRPPPDMSLYPWSQRRLQFLAPDQNPFPRYGAATNALASPKGEIYMMGGLINGSKDKVKGDLWTIEATPNSLSCSPVTTQAEGPGPRVGHAALLVGNAFIVFGGDTKTDEMDVLDDTLYLLNTSTKHWSRTLPAGQRPAGRYGHTLNILGSRIYIFGGQVEGHFFNDLVAFDLNALQSANNRWEVLIRNTNDNGPPPGESPPPRTNHTIITWNNKLFLFGGTDGQEWYNDVWAYDPNTNAWSPQECIGFIPTAREGHAAALVGDVMYVFGGRTEEGKDLGDLAAFRIPTRRWYTFQNMGPSPSPRSGHGMTAVGEKIHVVGGEPSSAPRDPSELSLTYVLDTSKIRYPADQSLQNGPRPGSRRPSVGDRGGTPSQERSGSSQGQYPNGIVKWQQRNTSSDSMNEQQQQPRAVDSVSPVSGPGAGAGPLGKMAAPARSSPVGPPVAPPPGGPPPSVPMQQQQQLQSQQQNIPQVRSNGLARPPFAGPDSREPPRFIPRTESPMANGLNSPTREPPAHTRPTSPPGSFPHSPPRHPVEPTHSYSTGPAPNQLPQASQPSGTTLEVGPRAKRQQASLDSTSRDTVTTADDNYKTPMEHSDRSLDAMGSQLAADSGLGSSPALSQQHESLMKELEAVRTKNAWYASELSLARKSGYRSSTAGSPATDEKVPNSFEEDDKPLLEALMKMRHELAALQNTLAKQQNVNAEQVAQIERQRDAAINEAIYHKTRSTPRNGKDRDDSLDLTGPGADREQDSARRLAIALSSQAELQSRIHTLVAEIEAERKARLIAEESADTAHNRAAELDSHKQTSSLELERLRSELHEAQNIAREEAANAAEHRSNTRGLQVDKNELSGKLAVITEQSKNHNSILSSLREAVDASTEKATVLEKKLEYERRERSSIEEKLVHLKNEHESRVSELESTARRLQDAEDLAASHAVEARTHREAVLAGFGRVSDRGLNGSEIQDERVEALQAQLDDAKEVAEKNQHDADKAHTRLRAAEERIAGLEAYQEQSSREGLNLRKQLQTHSREAVILHSEKADLQQQLSNYKVDSAALQVQHSSLRELLAERGIDPDSSPARNRSAAADDARFKDLEAQLDAQSRAHEDMRQSFEQRQEEANRGWEEKLAALDNDYQAAVKYLKGTEKMLSRMKQELHRYKTANKDLEEELTRAKKNASPDSDATTPTPPPSWETERNKLRSDVDAMSAKVTQSQQQLEHHMAEARAAHAEREIAQQALAQSQKQSEGDLRSLKQHNETLEKRAEEAERKVQTLLDTVGTSVENYRHSRQINGLHPDDSGFTKGHSRGFSASSLGAESNYSNPGEAGPHINDRNSVALDSLASELETLRSHWETTNKNYRSSQQSVNVTTPVTPGGHMTSEGESLANWRRKLDLREREESAGRDSSGASPHR